MRANTRLTSAVAKARGVLVLLDMEDIKCLFFVQIACPLLLDVKWKQWKEMFNKQN